MKNEKRIQKDLEKYAPVLHLIYPTEAVTKFQNGGDLEDWWDDIEQFEKDNHALLYPLQIAQERKREGYKRIDKKLQCFIPDWESFMKNHRDPKTATKYLNDVIQIIQNMENITLNFKGNGVWAVMKVVPQVLVTETKMLNK